MTPKLKHTQEGPISQSEFQAYVREQMRAALRITLTTVLEEELTALGDEGVLALVCDSTNAFNPNPSGSEGAVFRGLMEEVARHRGRRMAVSKSTGSGKSVR